MALTLMDLKDRLLEISQLAGEVFDAVEERGMDAIMDPAVLLKMKAVEGKTEEYMAYVFVQNTLAMHHLGIDVTKFPGHDQLVRRFLGPIADA